tara:strand:+ start:454 stop:561 length:108 start_codon:yes stop_codon:yes gene_type:complete
MGNLRSEVDAERITEGFRMRADGPALEVRRRSDVV